MKEKIRTNPYRILGVYSNSSLKDIKTNISKIKAYCSVNKPIVFESDFNLCLGDIDRNTDSIYMAESLLLHPENKLKFSLSWFCCYDEVDKQGLDLLRAGDTKKALKKFQSGQSVSNLINSAVCHCVLGKDDLYLNTLRNISDNALSLQNLKNIVLGDTAEYTEEQLKKIIGNYFDEIGKGPYSVNTLDSNSSIRIKDKKQIEMLSESFSEFKNDYQSSMNKGAFGTTLKNFSGFAKSFYDFVHSIESLVNTKEFRDHSLYSELCDYADDIVYDLFDRYVVNGRWLQHPLYLEKTTEQLDKVCDLLKVKDNPEYNNLSSLLRLCVAESLYAKNCEVEELTCNIFPSEFRKTLQNFSNNILRTHNKINDYLSKERDALGKLVDSYFGVIFYSSCVKLVKNNIEIISNSYVELLNSDISAGAKKIISKITEQNFRFLLSSICGKGTKLDLGLHNLIPAVDDSDAHCVATICNRLNKYFKKTEHLDSYHHVLWLMALSFFIERCSLAREKSFDKHIVINSYFDSLDEDEILCIDGFCLMLRNPHPLFPDETRVVRDLFYRTLRNASEGQTEKDHLTLLAGKLILNLLKKTDSTSIPTYLSDIILMCNDPDIRALHKTFTNYELANSKSRGVVESTFNKSYEITLKNLRKIILEEDGEKVTDDFDFSSEDNDADEDDFDDDWDLEAPSSHSNTKKRNVRKKLTKKQKKQKRKAKRNNR